ncbi:sensor histidine kinase [Leptolyngbya ohadii]|uniref:sensor histidine kinase n=1 Tax=Leptolyngbya ohadii TaxID=1962290 RepID=UPI000B59B251|nr:ATP-binding protein [Leptolyngbya ohadii]
MVKEYQSAQGGAFGLFWEETEDAVLILDRRNCCIAVSQAVCKLLGVSEGELLDRSIAPYISLECGQFRHLKQRLIRFQIVRPDQQVRSIEATIIPNRRLQQELWLLHDVTVDWDWEKAIERALSQQNIPEIFAENAPVGMLVLDCQSRVMWLNPTMARITGMPIEELLGQAGWDFVPGVAQQQIAIYEQVLATGKPVLNVDISGTLLRQPEIKRTWLVSYFPIQSPSSTSCTCPAEIGGIGVIVRDITEVQEVQSQLQQVNAELEIQVQHQTAELQQSLQFEAMLKRITDKVRDSLDETQILQTAVEELQQALEPLSCDMGLYDLERKISAIAYESIQTDVPVAKGTIVSMNLYPEVYDRLLSGEHLHFCWISNRDTPAVRLSHQQLTMLAVPMMDGQEAIGDMWLYRPNERPFEAAEIRLVQQFANQCAIALRQSRLYQASQKQVHELERLNRLKDDFLSTVSHELRTPMANLKMAVQMLELHLTPLGLLTDASIPIASYYKILSEECDREMLLINDLLDMARLDAETELFQVAPIDLTVWLPHVAEVFHARMAHKQQQLMLAIDPDLPSLATDLFYLERMVVELLTNACKYTPTDETIQLAAQPTSDWIQVQVRNTGVEIPPAECDRIFDKFYRIPNSDPWKHGGTGLGLALVQKMAYRLGGAIRVESGSDRGKGYTCFTLTLPYRLQE